MQDATTVTNHSPDSTEALDITGALVAPEPEPERPKTHTRAGFTTHKGRGQSKARRKMTNASRRRNRK